MDFLRATLSKFRVKTSPPLTIIDDNDVVYVKVRDFNKGDVVFEGKVSLDLLPRDLLLLRCFWERDLGWIRSRAALNEEISSFKEHEEVELVATFGPRRNGFSGILFVSEDDVVRKSKSAPSHTKSKMMSCWRLSPEECANALDKCTNVKELSINWSEDMTHLPKEIGMLNKLKKLRLYAMYQLKSVDEVGRLSHLKELCINYCFVDKLPEGIAGLQRLEQLTLVDLPIVELPQGIWKLSMLKELHIEKIAIESLPESIGGLKNLEKLTLSALDKLKSIPHSLCYVTRLENLELKYLPIMFLPARLKLLKSMTLVHLRNLQLSQEDMSVFSRLKKLHFEDCVLQESMWKIFCETLKASSFLLSIHLSSERPNPREMLLEGLRENGSIIEGSGDVAVGFEEVFRRNKSNRKRAMSCVVQLLAIKRWRNVMNNVPKEMVTMISMTLWMMRCDVKAWAEK